MHMWSSSIEHKIKGLVAFYSWQSMHLKFWSQLPNAFTSPFTINTLAFKYHLQNLFFVLVLNGGNNPFITCIQTKVFIIIVEWTNGRIYREKKTTEITVSGSVWHITHTYTPRPGHVRPNTFFILFFFCFPVNGELA